MEDNYIFKSDRLGFRNWKDKDIEAFTALNADKDVMQYFPNVLTQEETEQFIARQIKHYIDYSYNYFATEILATGEFIGFIGLAFQTYPTHFTPATDIGWRLKKTAWGKGYATEGAKRCLEFAFNELKLDKIIATCTLANTKSEQVMQKIGMMRKGVFKHPRLQDYPEIENCIWYEIEKTS